MDPELQAKLYQDGELLGRDWSRSRATPGELFLAARFAANPFTLDNHSLADSLAFYVWRVPPEHRTPALADNFWNAQWPTNIARGCTTLGGPWFAGWLAACSAEYRDLYNIFVGPRPVKRDRSRAVIAVSIDNPDDVLRFENRNAAHTEGYQFLKVNAAIAEHAPYKGFLWYWEEELDGAEYVDTDETTTTNTEHQHATAEAA